MDIYLVSLAAFLYNGVLFVCSGTTGKGSFESLLGGVFTVIMCGGGILVCLSCGGKYAAGLPSLIPGLIVAIWAGQFLLLCFIHAPTPAELRYEEMKRRWKEARRRK